MSPENEKPKDDEPVIEAREIRSSIATESDIAKLPPDHPVHKIAPEKRDKMRRKGVNPVSKAEIDHELSNDGRSGRFWSKVSLTTLGGHQVR